MTTAPDFGILIDSHLTATGSGFSREVWTTGRRLRLHFFLHLQRAISAVVPRQRGQGVRPERPMCSAADGSLHPPLPRFNALSSGSPRPRGRFKDGTRSGAPGPALSLALAVYLY